MTYSELKERHQAEINSFPMMFAFSNQQFKEGMERLGLDETETDKIFKFGESGGFYLKTDAPRLEAMFERQEKELKEAISGDVTGAGFIFDMFLYELDNHEYCITGTITDALRALGISRDAVRTSPALMEGLKLACRKAGGRLREADLAPEYCSQNAGDCGSCSLVNYGRDCMNNLITATGRGV